MLRRRDKRGGQRYISACHVLASITLSYCSSRILPRFIIRSVTWIYSTILLRISSGSLSNLALLLSCLLPLSKERRSRGSIYENERYKGVHRGYLPLRRIIMASSNRGYKCLVVNNSSWGREKKKEKKLSLDIPLHLVGMG